MPYVTETRPVGPDDVGRRLDRIVRAIYPELPLSAVYRLLRDGDVRVAGRRVDGSYRVQAGDVLELRVKENAPTAPSGRLESEAPRQAAPREERNDEAARAFKRLILTEGPDLCIVNKPRGLLSHGPGGLDELARQYYAERVAASLAFAPAPLHRLDRNTSGALVVSASQEGAVTFSAALREGRIGKTYLALLTGSLREPATWEDTLLRDPKARTSRIVEGGMSARARMIPLLTGRGLTLSIIELDTGRTHQIRAQAAARGHPLAGDTKYGAKPSPDGAYLLHAVRLIVPQELRLGAGLPETRATVLAPVSAWAQQTISRAFGVGYETALASALAGKT